MELGYCGFYRWHVVVAGHGHAMVAVHHEVGFPELVELLHSILTRAREEKGPYSEVRGALKA
jgi:hypothetical protein